MVEEIAKRYSVPVAIIVFNRVALAEKMLKILERLQPEKLFVISDGARTDKPEEMEKVQQVRRLFDKLSWDCEVYRNYAEENMGCDYRVPSGISWVFEYVDRAIILEDDCMPALQFFQYAADMLEEYRDNPSVMMIAGSNMSREYEMEYSCCFTSRVYCWGWATWKRAWKYYCDNESEWKRIQADGTFAKTYPYRSRYYVKKELNYYFKRGKCPWDYLWWISCIGRGGLCAVPKVNLIANEGFGADATHTQEKGSYNGQTFSIDFPLRFPPVVERDRNFEKCDDGLLNRPWKIVRVVRKFKKILKR